MANGFGVGIELIFGLVCCVGLPAVSMYSRRRRPSMIEPTYGFDLASSANVKGGLVVGNWPMQIGVTWPFGEMTIDQNYICLWTAYGGRWNRRMPSIWISRTQAKYIQPCLMGFMLQPGTVYPEKVRFNAGSAQRLLNQYGWFRPEGEWEPDPYRRHQLRYATPQGWTEYVSDNGIESIDPIPPAGFS